MKRIRLIKALQEAAFADEVYQNYRKSLIAVCADQVHNLNTSLISVRLNLRYVEKFKTEGAFDFIGDEMKKSWNGISHRWSIWKKKTKRPRDLTTSCIG